MSDTDTEVYASNTIIPVHKTRDCECSSHRSVTATNYFVFLYPWQSGWESSDCARLLCEAFARSNVRPSDNWEHVHLMPARIPTPLSVLPKDDPEPTLEKPQMPTTITREKLLALLCSLGLQRGQSSPDPGGRGEGFGTAGREYGSTTPSWGSLASDRDAEVNATGTKMSRVCMFVSPLFRRDQPLCARSNTSMEDATKIAGTIWMVWC